MEQEKEVGQIPIRRIVVLIAVPFMLLAYFLMPMFSWPKISMWEVLANVIGSRYVPTSVTISLIILLIIPFLELCLFIPKETHKTIWLNLSKIQSDSKGNFVIKENNCIYIYNPDGIVGYTETYGKVTKFN